MPETAEKVITEVDLMTLKPGTVVQFESSNGSQYHCIVQNIKACPKYVAHMPMVMAGETSVSLTEKYGYCDCHVSGVLFLALRNYAHAGRISTEGRGEAASRFIRTGQRFYYGGMMGNSYQPIPTSIRILSPQD